ncbi:MAG: thiamine pyrophosphate-binding protein [Dehalococcoidia bacterium]|nr:thiamine pyrophosphate-binding protein [Chloroflexota bacterium]
MAQMTTAQALVRSLVREGVEVVFGLPGVQIMDIYDAFYDEPGIRLVTTRHEQTAAYMADGYSRSTGKIGVALVVPGPGLLNAAAGIGTAYASSSPVLLIAGQVESYNINQGRGAVHEVVDQLDVLKNITKWRSAIMEPGQVPEAVHEAMRQLKTGRPRPVALEVPSDVLPKAADVDLLEPEVFPKQSPDPVLVKEAVSLLSKAQRPVIWAGSGVNSADANGEITRLAEAINAAVIATAEGKGAIAENHPQYAGPCYYGHGSAHQVIPQADAILAVGSRLHFFAPVSWAFKPEQDLIHIDADPEELGRNWPEKVSICADAKLALKAILAELEGRSHSSQWSREEIAHQRNAAYQVTKEQAPNQVEIIETLREELADDAIVISGIASIGYWSHLAFPVLTPRSYLNTSYFATLGYAFPTALGAKVGNPDRQVVAFCGDGGFMYALSDLATAVQEGINVVAIVFNDGALGASLMDQEVRYRGRVIGTKLHNPDFAMTAQAFGAEGIKLEDRRQLGEALSGALKAEKPVVLEVPIESWTPPFQISPPGAL